MTIQQVKGLTLFFPNFAGDFVPTVQARIQDKPSAMSDLA
jgi:hypothetical protein